MLRIKSIDIKGIGPIKQLSLAFNDSFNIICGANGIGKTTILDCIAQSFAFNNITLRRNKFEGNEINACYKFNENAEEHVQTSIAPNRPYDTNNLPAHTLYDQAKELIVFRTSRSINYLNLNAIQKDPMLKDWQIANQATEGCVYSEIKQWLVNRYLWSKHENALKQEQLHNLGIALDVINGMKEGFTFSKIDPETNDILINTPAGEVVLEQLSAGYIAYLIVVLGLIKDIEYRFKEPHICVKDFSGVVIIDEIDIHLHPTLQTKLYHTLKEILPKAQIFTSSHSPHVIQAAAANEIIALVPDGDNIAINPIVNKEYGCCGWTVEEILSDVMGMQDTRSYLYKEALKKFEDALNKNDKAVADAAFDKLSAMIHPNSIMRKVLEIQKI